MPLSLDAALSGLRVAQQALDVASRNVSNAATPGYTRKILPQESLVVTGIGLGVGIPHGKSTAVRQLIGAFGLSRDGVDFESLDGEPAHIFFLLIAPKDSAGPHLKALARISRLLRDKYFRERLRNAKDEKEVMRVISEEDKKLDH